MTYATRLLTVLWPAFLIAGMQEALIFVVVDPHALRWFGVTPIEWPVQTIYSVTFLILWATTGTACALCRWLGQGGEEPPPHVNVW